MSYASRPLRSYGRCLAPRKQPGSSAGFMGHCRLRHVWLGYKVWRELSRPGPEQAESDPEPVLFHDVLPIIERLPEQVVNQVRSYSPPKRKPGFGALIFATVFLFSGLLFVSKVLGEVVPAVMEALVARPGEVLLQALLAVGLWLFAGYCLRQVKRLREFVSMLCWLGQQAELAT